MQTRQISTIAEQAHFIITYKEVNPSLKRNLSIFVTLRQLVVYSQSVFIRVNDTQSRESGRKLIDGQFVGLIFVKMPEC